MDDSETREKSEKETEMNEQKIIEAMAKADGYEKYFFPARFSEKQLWFKGIDQTPCDIPDYLTDGEIDRMVRGLDEVKASMYGRLLHEVMSAFLGRSAYVADFVQAPEEKKVEAYLRAIGKWTKEME